MTDFRFNGKGNKVWDKDSLKRTLVRDYPGAQSLQEAVAMARNNGIETKADVKNPDNPEIKPTPLSTAVIDSEIDPVALAWRNAVAGQERAEDAHPNWRQSVSLEDLQRVALMPVRTVEEINAWSQACIDLIHLHK